jgi:RimJ/RimL family protein N-acetyltransferase
VFLTFRVALLVVKHAGLAPNWSTSRLFEKTACLGKMVMLLRPHCEEDTSVFKKECADDRLEIMTCRPLKHGKRHYSEGGPICLTCVSTDGSPIGWFKMFDYNCRNRSSEFGFGLVPRYRGKGLSGRSLEAALDMALASSCLNKLYCQTASFNMPVVRLLERMSMHRDAILRAHHELDGVLYDDYVYSILRKEWEAKLG